MLTETPAPGPFRTASLADRRASARVEVISCVQGESGAGSVLLVNISEGGALVHGTFQPDPDEVHEFRFRSDDDSTPLVFAARVVHVEPTVAAERSEPHWAIGLEFVTTTEHQRRSIDRLLAHCTARG